MQECSEERYDEMLGILPPAVMLGKGFLVGEPFDHRTCSVTKVVRASYAAFFQKDGKFYEGDNMTVPEFRAFDVSALLSTFRLGSNADDSNPSSRIPRGFSFVSAAARGNLLPISPQRPSLKWQAKGDKPCGPWHYLQASLRDYR
jgi:hypothetical protein